ncbi:hypothetical protein [Mycolicibacterium farcinogenes]|uniref:Uncharacterized protein n=1 Tax=Mycolicibacterium farcinogenes TaxID=1802 RepID=A0ACD1FKX7_MYCFR|nr:hypothetical protein [Mycolicibacterium farcinogenes]QZH67697.1 hypothetical protein K6L26_08725 [Mycolicibacterium farcinogenes]
MSYFGVVAGKGEWPKSYVIPSVVLSVTAAGFLIWHVVDPAGRIDAWTVTLLIVGFLPWLRPIFESIAFPGGASLKYRQLEAKQDKQEDEIRALKFLVANFLPAEQKRVLRRLATDGPYDFTTESEPGEVLNALGHLQIAGLLEQNPSLTRETAPKLLADGGSGDVKIMFRITAIGREYLKHLDSAEG